jgi:glycerol-3-phosphate dehydrogenase
MNHSTAPLLIIGAGVNGVAIAREMLLNNQPVVIVDRADLASGASAYNSRLIHGGLRYLEYAEYDLVRESLAERDRLLEHASHLVKPLELFIPCQNRWGGVWAAAKRFLGRPVGKSTTGRGWWLVRIGLAMYDRYTRRGQLPQSQSCKVGDPHAPPVAADRYRWFCSYHDAQVQFPERLVLAQLADCRKLAAEKQLDFQLLTYHHVRRQGDQFEIMPIEHRSATAESRQPITISPAAIVNATGASVDDSLQQIKVDSKQLIGGTKGSHLITRQAPLCEALSKGAIYAEATDGRPVFLLPFGDAVLIGTTDIPFEGDPANAVASQQEIDYLITAVNQIFPQVGLTNDDIDQHYCGVRPLPYVAAASTSSITRRHSLHRHAEISPPLFSVIGGKLTTARQLAEDVASEVLPALDRAVLTTTRQRPLPGNPSADNAFQNWADSAGIAPEHARRIWQLCGSEAQRLTLTDAGNATAYPQHPFPPGFVRGVIREEWPRHLTDLVERRLMLVYDPHLSEAQLGWLTELLVEEGLVPAEHVQQEVADCISRLESMFGKRVIQ